MRKGHPVKGYVESKIERVYPLEHEYTHIHFMAIRPYYFYIYHV